MSAHFKPKIPFVRITSISLLGFGLVFSSNIDASDMSLAYYYGHRTNAARMSHPRVHSTRANRPAKKASIASKHRQNL